MRLKTLLVIAMLTITASQASAQDLYKLETPYEKARAQLVDETVNKIIQGDIQLALTMGLAINKMQEEEWSEWKQMEFGEELIAMVWGAYNWTEPQTYSDFRNFQRIGPACEEYARKREALEKTKTSLDIERERMRNYVPPIGALSTVMKATGEEFAKSMKKGTYEKNAQFRQRIAETGPSIFDSIANFICLSHALSSLQNVKQNYDVENEIDSLYLWHRENNKMIATCSMTPEMKQRVVRKDKKIQGDETRVCVVNGEVLPYKIVLATDEEDEKWMYESHPLAKNAVMDTNVVFSVAKTGITDTVILQVIGNHVFDYNNHKDQQAIKKQERIAKKAQEELEERLAKQLYETLYVSLNFEFRKSISSCDCEKFDRKHIEDAWVRKVYELYDLAYEEDAGYTTMEGCNRIQTLLKQIRSTDAAREYIKKNHLTEMDVRKVINEVILFHNYYYSYDIVLGTIAHIASDEYMRYTYGRNQFSLKKFKERGCSSQIKWVTDHYEFPNVYRVFAKWVVENDKKASKEWGKHKDKYKDIVEFYEHYISDDYKPRQ